MSCMGLASYPKIFRGRSSSLRRVSVRGPFLFKDFSSLPLWLDRLSATKQLRSLCLDGIRFGYEPDVWTHNPDIWPSISSTVATHWAIAAQTAKRDPGLLRAQGTKLGSEEDHVHRSFDKIEGLVQPKSF
jgi:hypothetical protein